MKILHVVPSYKPAYVYGGTIESVSRLCEATAHAGVEVKVFTTNANGDELLDVIPNKEYDVDSVKVIYFKRIFKDPYYISPVLWRRLFRECKQYDIVHIHSWWNMIVIISAFICRFRKVKVVLSPHGMISNYILEHSKAGLKKFIHLSGGKRLLQYMRFHATSKDEYKECKNFIPAWKGFTLSNIVWLPVIKILKKPNAIFTIVYLSRIHPKKGIELLMEAISKLNEKVLLQIAGDGDKLYVESLKNVAEVLSIESQVEWLGWQDREEKFDVLMKADLFALTSYNENFGNVVVEALNVGTPALISKYVGLYCFVEENDFGWICDTDVNDIIVKLQSAINNTERKKIVIAEAPQKARFTFSEVNIMPQYLKQYAKE